VRFGYHNRMTRWLHVAVYAALAGAAVVFILALRGFLSWTTMTAAFTLIALIASVGSLGYQIWRTGLVQAADLMMRFEQNFFGPDKVKQRSLAAQNYLKDPNDYLEMEDILDFFETIAMLTRKGALDLYMVWHTFDYWIERYFAVAAPYIRARQLEEPGVWEDLSWLVPKLAKMRGAKEKPLRPLGVEVQAAFLTEEAAES
jgi:hypothetical protein